jgi:hypothetical protein
MARNPWLRTGDNAGAGEEEVISRNRPSLTGLFFLGRCEEPFSTIPDVQTTLEVIRANGQKPRKRLNRGFERYRAFRTSSMLMSSA